MEKGGKESNITMEKTDKHSLSQVIKVNINSEIALGSIVIFTILILPIQEHGISLHLFVSSLISFISNL